jgi:hypothetical protein
LLKNGFNGISAKALSSLYNRTWCNEFFFSG